jgi:hypothetical protein
MLKIRKIIHSDIQYEGIIKHMHLHSRLSPLEIDCCVFIIAFSGYTIFWLYSLLVIAFSGYSALKATLFNIAAQHYQVAFI